ARLGRRAAGGAYGYARRVVVPVGQGDVCRLQPVVVRIGARRPPQYDRVGDFTVYHEVVHAGDGHGLGDVPLGRRERHRRDGNGLFGRVGAAHGDGDVGGGLAGERDGERGGAAGLAGRAAGRAD